MVSCSSVELRRAGYDRDQGAWPKKASLRERSNPSKNPLNKIPIGQVQQGVVSWYGKELAGRQTASGEIFDPSQLTAAHREYPFGTRLKVTLISTGKSVEVRVNDRGPYAPGRILDLSASAAQTIGLGGVGEAKIEVISWGAHQ